MNSSRGNGEQGGGQPVVRLRSMFIGLCVLVVSIAGPLVLVWKQSYINQVSLRLENRADTLASMNREITSLNLERGRLALTPRIERIARSQGLEYPASGQLEILEVKVSRQKKEKSGGKGAGGFFARVRQSILGESG